MRHSVSRIQAGEAAEILGVDRKTVHRLREQGVLHTVEKKDGPLGPYKFDEAEVYALAAKRRKKLEEKLARINGVAS